MICKECGYDTYSPVYFDMKPIIDKAFVISDEAFEPIPLPVFWGCVKCDRIHWKNGDLYMPPASTLSFKGEAPNGKP